VGTSLSLSGVFGASADDVVRALKKYAARKWLYFELLEGSANGEGVGMIAEGNGACTVLYPYPFYNADDVSRRLSNQLKTAVFSLHIHDGDLWMLYAYDNGKEVSWFNSYPDYWFDLEEAEQARCVGDAAVIARLANLPMESIQNYFVLRNHEASLPAGKAYESDEYENCDPWQMLDFMRRVGLPFPEADNEQPAKRPIYLHKKKPPVQAGRAIQTAQTPANRPWWKLW
jgi:hypothetical protein